ncbi:hypothetical protein QTP88_000489 [Uroleucon formosanum]
MSETRNQITICVLGSDCCKRWAYVRDYYIRRKGKPGTGSSGEAAKNRSVLLSFLDSLPSSQRQNTITNVVGDEVRFDETELVENSHADLEENITHIDETEENMTIININSNEDNSKKMDSKKDNIMRDKKKIKLTHSEERLHLLKQIAERNSTPVQNELDETDLFFNSMAKIVKKLPRYEQLQLRMQISSLVRNTELKSILGDSRQADLSTRPSSTMSFIHSETVPSPSTSGTSNYQGQIYEESSQRDGRGDSESVLSLTENDQFFLHLLPIRGANPGDPFSGREVAEISVDHLLIQESDLNLNTEDLLLNVTKELKEVYKSIIEFNKKTLTNMDENSGASGSSNQPSNTQQPKTKEPVQQVDWAADNNSHHIFSGIEGMNKQSMGQVVNGGTNNGSMESKKENSVHTEHLKGFDLDALINQRMKELCQNYSLKVENADQEKANLESIREIIDAKIIAALGKKGYTGTPQPEPSMSNYIGLKEALNLLPNSCDGRDIEQLDIFLENCEFAVSCVQEPSKNRLLQAIMTRLTEELQTLLIEQETAELTAEAARAMEASIKRQTKQVFMEGLGVFKDFIKARNPHTLEMAIQAAREEEKIKTSSVETKKLYQPTKRGTESYTSAKKPNGPCHLLVDSGSDLNFIKLSSLKDDVMVHEPTEHILTGITGHVLQSLGTVELTLTIKQEKRKALFQVVHSSFPVPHEGILGKPLIIGMKTVIDYQRKELMLTDISASIGTTESLNNSEQAESPKTGRDNGSPKLQDITNNQINGNIVLRPRTETLVSIPITDQKDGEIVLVPAQTIAKTIMCSNTINKSNEETSANGSRLNKLNEEIHTEHLNKEEYDSLMTICKQFSDIFHLEGDKLSCTNAVYHEINVNPATQPINERPYRLPYKHKQEIDKQIQKLQEDDIIAPSRSPWNAPLLVVPKKPTVDGTAQYRVCVDFRKLNQVSVGDAFPLPNITEILDQLGKSKYYSTLDLSQGYHQVPMHPDHQSKTAFSTDKGHFEFLRVPFGLKGAPETFQRLMNTVLTGLNGLKAFVYLDDIIIYALNITDHSKKLEEVFKKLREFNLKLNPSKCSFMRKEVNYLGHVITDKGVKPDPQKIKCVLGFPIPTNTKELKSFLGLSGYYRRFVPNYGQTSKPLTALLKKDAQFSWSDLCQEAFEKLKSTLTQEPLLQYPDFTKAFNLTCDASNFAIGCVLSQGPIGQDVPIAYASRNLNKAEQNYNTTEKELCAIVWGVKQFRPYLLGQKFTIITDHRALTWLFNIRDPGSRLTRWRLKLEEYEYENQYKQDTSNTNADALIRIHPVVTRSKSASEIAETPGITENLDTTNITGNPDNQNLQNLSTTVSPASGISEPYQQFLAAKHSPTANVTEVNGDIFDTSSDVSLVHCVSGDLNMSRGLALQFRRKFGQVTQLQGQRKKLTEIAYIRQDERMVFYLITKEYYRQKPSYETFYKSLQNLKEACM